MTNEVEEGTVVTAKDESDWAMNYSEERNRRVKAERRLGSMAFAATCLLGVVDNLMAWIVNPEQVKDRDVKSRKFQQDGAKLLYKVMSESFDLEQCLHLNTFDPPHGTTRKEREALIAVRNRPDPRPDQMRTFEELAERNGQAFKDMYVETMKEWDLLSAQNNFESRDDQWKRRAEDMMKRVMVILFQINEDEGIHDEVEKTTTH